MNLDPDLVKEAKIAAIRSNTSFSELIEDGLRVILDAPSARKAQDS